MVNDFGIDSINRVELSTMLSVQTTKIYLQVTTLIVHDIQLIMTFIIN